MLRHYFLTTIRTLRQNPLYTALSVFGIALTFVFVCILLLLLKATKGDFIPPKYTERTWQVQRLDTGNGNNRWINKELYETWIPKMKTPEIIVANNFELLESVVLNDNIMFFMIKCVSENYFDVCRFKFIHGRPISKQEIADAIPVAVIDLIASTQYFGKDDPVGKSIELFGNQYRVVGVVESVPILVMDTRMADANIWVPLNSVQRDHRYVISFTAKNKSSVADIQAEFARVLDETNTAEGVQYSIPNYRKETLKGKTDFLDMFSIIGILILMIIPAVNILSLNVSKSFDRSEEIAIRKAFGAPIRTVIWQLFFENTLITLAGAVIGMCITPPILHAIDQMMLGVSIIPLTLSLKLDWTTIFMIAFPCVLLFSFLSGSIPAWITAKRNIVNVLKGESQ